MSFSSTAVHAAGVAIFGYSFYYDIMFVHPSAELAAVNEALRAAKTWPGKWKYLTVWNVVLQLVYHVVALLNDLFGSSELNLKRQTFLQKLRDGYFASWVFPTSTFVCVAFWVLVFIDPILIVLPANFPNWLNQVFHTVPIAHVLLESFLVPHSHQSTALTFGIIIFGYFGYVAWIVWINSLDSTWPYPILSLLGPSERVVFIAAGGVIIFAFYFLGEQLNKWRWGTLSVAAKNGKKKSN